MNEIDTIADDAIARSEATISTMVDRIFVRVLALCGLLFVGALILVIVWCKLSR